RITRFNRAFEHLTGYKADEVISQELPMLFPEASRDESLHKIARTLSGEYWESIEIPILRKDGETRLALWNSANIYAEDGKTLLTIIAQGTDITERERAEEALRESQEHAQFLADVLERSSQPFAVGYPDGQLMTYNTAYCKLLGYSKEELHELQWLTDLTPPEWREVVAKAAEEIGRTGQPQRFEKEYIRKDGSRVPVEVFAHPIFDSKGNIQYFYSFFTDITERKRIEHNLKESENKFRGIAERSFDLIFTTDKGGYLTYVSPAAEKIFYFKPEEMVGKHFKNFLVESEIPRVFQRFSENLEGKNLGVFSMEAIRKDGSHIFAELNSSPILENGEIVGMQGAIRDITKRKQVEEAQIRLASAVRLSTDSIVLSDIEGKIIGINEATLEMYGTDDKGALIGKSSFDLIAPEDREKAIAGVKKVLEKGYIKSREYQVITKNGDRIPVEMSVACIKDVEGKPVGFVGISRDITERKRAEKEREQNFERLQRTLEGTVHALAAAVEMKDPYTAGHQRRVTQLACSIAEEMGLSEDRIAGIHVAGLIHDIGKINVPAEILSKPGPLNDTEYNLTKYHPQVGHDILNEIDFPWPVAQIVLQHHERMDGSGYPQGLKGEEILLEARILGVADAVEAMSAHRPYRPARGIDKALEEIAQNKGKLYDSKVVDACLRLFTEDRFHFKE
ncbi:PAS domain S-box protein, partial [Candidatus Bipolaricaulota bacterium]|nr:PAS domain S-box protein [Candidatus Bipolaricaulota bacterium]